MNVKVITRHTPSNYGSLLQAFATIDIINKLGHNCEIIDYHRPNERGIKNVISQLKNKNKYCSFLKRLAYIAVRYPIELYSQVKFDAMHRKYLTTTACFTNPDDLKQLQADVFITGSDQVWGPTADGHFDSSYFLNFVDDSVPKIAYSASFGRTEFDDATIDAYKKLLLRYNAIAVREKSAVELIKMWQLNNCVGQVLDPTLLLNRKEWLNLIPLKNYAQKYAKKKYILIYQIHNDPTLSIYAKNLAKHLNLNLLRVSPSFHQIMRSGKLICCPDLPELFALFDNAECIVTDSFHGTCFSIIFEKQFIEILPNNGTSTRNQNILEMTNLSDRIVTDFNDFSIAGKPIDYKNVRSIIETERVHSINVLKEELGLTLQ